MRHATILVVIFAFVPLAGSAAQVQQPPVERGARVRVTRPPICPPYTTCAGGLPQHYVGTFVTWEVDALVVQSSGNTLGAGIGFLLGGVMGAVFGYASHEECVPQGGFSCIGPDFGPEGGGLGGLVLGAIIGGSPEVRLDRLRVSLGPQRDGGLGLGASVRF